MADNRRWKFFRAGGVDQVLLRDGADVVALDQLDQKLWVALAMPTRGVELDPRMLDLVDTDKDGRIRAPEILAAVAWSKKVLKNPDDLLKGGDFVLLSAIRDAELLGAAKRLLSIAGKPDADRVTVEDLAAFEKTFAAGRLNGDGVVPADSAEDEATRKAIEDVIAVVGAVPDRSGKLGVNQAKADAFFTEAKALADWLARPETERTILPLGDGTALAHAAVKTIKPKVDDFYARCRLAAFDARATGPLNRTEADYLAMAGKELSLNHEEIARLPLAHVEAGRVFALSGGLNPAWATAVNELAAKAVDPLLGSGKHALSDVDWNALQAKLAPYEAWMAAKPATAVEKLGAPRVRALIAQGARERIAELVAQDLALAGDSGQHALVEQLVLYQRDLLRLLNNFVSFSEFYGRKRASFQVGTLYLDGRACELCLAVADAGKHGALASLSAVFLAYCDCTRPNGEKTSIVAAFTDGDSDNLLVGRNGVFYDHKGRDWDATITKIVANPISVREAFWSPYKKLARLVEEQIAKRASAGEADSHARMSAVATSAANADKAKKEEAPKKVDVGTVAAIGVAVGGIGAMVAGVLGAFFGLGLWMPVGLLAAILLVSGPSMLLAFLKLRQRNLGPILDANGWAINGRARINVPFGAALTRVATLPPGSERTVADPYAEKKRPWKTYTVLAVIVLVAGLWYLGKVDKYLPAVAKSVTVLGANAPSYEAPAPK